MAGIGLFIGCCITGVQTGLANSDLDDYCRDNYYNSRNFYSSDNNEVCETLERIYGLVLALTVSN